MVASTSKSFGHHCKVLVRLSCLLFVVLQTQVFATPNRCDIHRRVRHWSRCQECSLNQLKRCPHPYIHTSSGIGIRGCRIRIYFGSVIGVVTVPGCQHTCDKMKIFRECCPGFWGGLCKVCPGTPVCSSAGKCNDRLLGDGTCSCQDGFKGTACELCTNSTMFGPGCNQTCSCQRGVCESSVNSTGNCKPYSCQIGYIGVYCNTRLPACHHSISCAQYADCFSLNGTDTCVCEPGYTGDGKTNCTAINPCKGNSHGCHSNAICRYLGPGQHRCDCAQGYRGDGRVCIVIDPCQSNNGGCPKISSVCNFFGPGRSNCSCLPGFGNFTSGRGCSMIDMCNDGNHGGCDVNANCLMVKAGEKRCICKKAYRGNGKVCFGNIIKRTMQLNSAGPPGVKGLLNFSSLVFAHTLARPLADTGPFTAFIAIDGAIHSLSAAQKSKLLNNNDFASHVVRLHLVAADLDSVALKKLGKVTTLQGSDALISENSGSLFYSLTGSSTKAKIIASDFVAGNGIVHVIDKLLWHPGNYSYTANLTALQIIERNDAFSQFAAFLQLTGLDSYLRGLSGPVTVFAPDNTAFRFDKLTLDYLTKTDKGKDKLRSILKNHIVTRKIDVTDLMSLLRVTSLEGESNTVQRTRNGALLVGGKSQITEANILMKDGIMHRINNLLIPEVVLPLVPNYSYITKYTKARSVCYRCDTMSSFPNKGCPSGYTPTGGFIACQFILTTSAGLFAFHGCKMKSCLKANKIPECSRSYYGSNCRPCPGPIEKPCNFHGRCDDRIRGSGVCTCHPLFTGVACEKCAKGNMFGPDCNKTCTCVHGSCDIGMKGNGTCKPHSCQSGYHGINCDVTDKSCVGSSIRCHYKAHCSRENGTNVCKCNAGYEGSGLVCDEINPCTKPNRGGCHKDATCIKTGPATNNCTCDRGFHGDGLVCIAINPCKQGFQHSCHSNAQCKFIGPGQSSCECKAGYTGSGRDCIEINNCLLNNGGCSPKARCYRVGPGRHNCTCFYGYAGNGYSCLGSVATILQEDRRFASIHAFVKKAHLEYYLSINVMDFTVFAPSSDAITKLSVNDSKYWTYSTDRMKYLIQYHLVNNTLLGKDLKNQSSLTVINGKSLNITYKNNTIILNGQAHVIQADIVGANGVIHIIDKVLVPHRLPESQLPSVNEALSQVVELSNFYHFVKQADFKTKLDTCMGCTIFAPVDDALRKYTQHRNMTLATLKYHVVTKYILPGHFYDGQQFRTMLGINYIVKLTKPRPEKNAINGIMYYTNAIKTKHSIIYKLSAVLKVPTPRRCDSSKQKTARTLCRMCVFQNNCPSGWTKLRTESCKYWIFFKGCRAVCRKTTITKKCCDGFWGTDCQACPGNVTSACYGNGKCLDGISGTGHCQCAANFTGTACEKCLPRKYGKTCSSNCECVNGKCSEGIEGDGTCRCRNGWQGPRCNVSADPKKCIPKVCSRLATCRSVNSSYDCDCDVGYTGNGTYCRAIHVCDTNNGGCHSNAKCSPNPTDPSLAYCSCINGYTGDGQFCSVIDLCQTNNGGCHANATCTNIGPVLRNCFCHKGYTGDGISCKPDDPCTENHGGCSLRATCKKTGPGQRQCTCGAMYYGNGETCIGNSMEILTSDPELSKITELYKTYHLDSLLASNAKANILAPTNQALSKILNRDKRKRRSVSRTPSIEQYLRYHIIGCVRINNYTLQTGGRFVSLLGAPIWIGMNDSQVVFRDARNNTARMTQGFESANGFVFKLDAVLSPPVEYLRSGDPAKPYIKVASELGYTTTVSLLKQAGLQNIVSNPFERPYLAFIATNQAIDKLPSDLKARLTDPANIDELTTYIKYHVVHNAPVNLTTEFFLRSGGGVELRTMQGQSIFISCKGNKGDLYVNGVSRISKRDILFNGGVAFAVDGIMFPLGLGGNCDEIIQEKSHGRCGNCLSPESCAHDSSLVGTTNHNCSFDDGILGCQPICMRRKIERKCCKNFYGSDCRACPGGLGMPCGRRGQCDDGLAGTGKCNCSSGYFGTACERCTANISCPVSGSCLVNNGGCHGFATCSHASGHVNCTCQRGYEGDGFYCQMKDLCTANNGGCGVNATCYFQGPAQRRCQCKQGFYQLNDGCKAFVSSSPCSVNHGGCSGHAYCRVSNGTSVCTCWPSYVGNGISCHGNIIQTLGDTVKVAAFNKALHHLRLIGVGEGLFADLQVDSKYFTVFAPIDSAVRAKNFSFNLVKNHVVSGRIKLSTIHNVSMVTNVLNTKIMIRKLSNGGVTINGVAHVVGDIQATNGVIYIVDQTVPIVGQIPATATPPTTSTTKPTTQPSSPSTSSSSSTPPPSSSTPPSSSSSSSQPSSSSSKPILLSTAAKQPNKTSSTEMTPTTSYHTTTNSTVKPAVFGRHSKDKGVSGGVVAGVIIAVLVVILLVAGVVWYLRRRALLPSPAFRYKKENDTVLYDSDVFTEHVPSISYNNPMYDVSEPGPSQVVVHDGKSLPPPFSEHTDFTNPLYLEMKDRPTKNESPDDVFSFNDAENPGEEQC